MAQLYLWQPNAMTPETATRRFKATLDSVASTYAESYGQPFPVEHLTADHCLVGMIGPEPGIGGADVTTTGTVFAGVTEPDSPPAPPDSVSGIEAWLGRLRHVWGRWAAVAWQGGRVVAVNSPFLGLRLWWTEGPNGWALGTLPTPILALVGRPRAIDLDVATMTAAFGYVASSRGLFRGVSRFMPGDQVILSRETSPTVTRWATFDATLGPRQGLAYDDVVAEFGRRLVAMVGPAATRSSDPRLGLSGGRDSRLLAAALVRAGRPVAVQTGGPATSPDVVVARQVASALGLDHRVWSDAKATDTEGQRTERARTGGGARALPMTTERLAAWITLHDGTAPVSLARVRPDLSVRREVVSRSRGQLFNGLGGGIHRGAYFPAATDLDRPGTAVRGRGYVLDLFTSGVPLKRNSRELFEAELDDQGDALGDTQMPLSEWLTRFQYRFRGTFREGDTLAQGDCRQWQFAPLMDLVLVAVSREAPAAAKMSNRLVRDVAVHLAPELADVPYEKAPLTYRPEALVRILSRLGLLYAARETKRRLLRSSHQLAHADVLRAVWEKVYFGPGDHLWPELIDERRLRRLVRNQPASPLVRDLVVPELLARSDSSFNLAGQIDA